MDQGPGRCRQAGIPEDREFATKPELARQMIERAIKSGMPFGWVAADEVYGQNTPLRDWPEERGVRYVLAVPKSFPAATAAGRLRADELAQLVPAAGWQQLSCGQGAKGPRFYDWALIATTSPARHLLVRRSLAANARGERERAFFTCHAPAGTTLNQLVAVAGTRWAIEQCFQAAKNETGLDHYQGPSLRRLVPARNPVDARAGVPPGRCSSKGAPAAADNFPGHPSRMITPARPAPATSSP